MADELQQRTDARLLEHLVGSVLTSVVKAQGLAASQLIELIDEVGFEPAVPGQPRRARTFSFEFFRNEIDDETEEVVQRRVTATVPLLTLVNLPAIAIEEAKIEMDLRLVAHQGTGDDEADPSTPLKLYAVPAKKQLIRSEQATMAVDAAGTIKMQVTLRQQEPLGLDRVQALLEEGTDQIIEPVEPIEPIEPGPSDADGEPPPMPPPSPLPEPGGNLAEPAGPVGRDLPAVTGADPTPSTRKAAARSSAGKSAEKRSRSKKSGSRSTAKRAKKAGGGGGSG